MFPVGTLQPPVHRYCPWLRALQPLQRALEWRIFWMQFLLESAPRAPLHREEYVRRGSGLVVLEWGGRGRSHVYWRSGGIASANQESCLPCLFGHQGRHSCWLVYMYISHKKREESITGKLLLAIYSSVTYQKMRFWSSSLPWWFPILCFLHRPTHQWVLLEGSPLNWPAWR